jgi:bifunctional non-homologous end joining protein LigD
LTILNVKFILGFIGRVDLAMWCSNASCKPAFISIDLDPSDEDFGKAIKTAQAAKKAFEEYKLQSLVKTSGKTGIHLFLPCHGFTFPQARK